MITYADTFCSCGFESIWCHFFSASAPLFCIFWKTGLLTMNSSVLNILECLLYCFKFWKIVLQCVFWLTFLNQHFAYVIPLTCGLLCYFMRNQLQILLRFLSVYYIESLLCWSFQDCLCLSTFDYDVFCTDSIASVLLWGFKLLGWINILHQIYNICTSYCFKFLAFIYFWLKGSFVSMWAFSSCSAWGCFSSGRLFCCRAQAAGPWASVVAVCELQGAQLQLTVSSAGSLVVEHGLSCYMACGIFPN